jgi:hypothetical protein
LVGLYQLRQPLQVASRRLLAVDRCAVCEIRRGAVRLGSFKAWWSGRRERMCPSSRSNHATRSPRPSELVGGGVSTGPWARYGRCCMVIEGPAEVLHGRRSEREALERLLEAVRGGQSRVLVMCGEAGVGKTALLRSAIGSASGFRVMRAGVLPARCPMRSAALEAGLTSPTR